MKQSAPLADTTDVSAEQAPTFIEILIDETTSMHGVASQTITAFNDFIRDQKDLKEATCQVTMTKFSSNKVVTPYEMIDIAMVPDLNRNTYSPSGSTNLYDTMSDRISFLSEQIGEIKCNVLFLVLTDGEDNMSRRETAETIKRRLGDKMEAGWTFVYLGAHARALTEGLRMGFPQGNIKAFSTVEIATAMAATSNATTMYRSARSSGAVAVATSSANYFSGE